MQQLCRKVCNMSGDASIVSIYKGFGGWFHGKIGHETEEKGSSIVGFGEGKRERKRRGRRRISEGFLSGCGERRAKIKICIERKEVLQ